MPDLLRLPLGRFCNFVWWWATRDAQSQSDVEKFKARLWRPPKGVAPTVGPWSPEAETAAFGALKASLTK